MRKRLQQARAAGRKGGRATARRHGEGFRQERARAGGLACLMRYGKNYFRDIRRRRVA